MVWREGEIGLSLLYSCNADERGSLCLCVLQLLAPLSAEKKRKFSRQSISADILDRDGAGNILQ